MQIRHFFPSASACNDVSGTPAVSLRNSVGDLFVQHTERHTHSEGWHVFRNGRFLKLLERIEILEQGIVTGVTLTGESAYFQYEKNVSLGIKPLATLSGISFQASQPCQIRITLDVRQLDTYPAFGREYSLFQGSEGLLIHYQDPFLSSPVYLHIRSRAKARFIQKWEEAFYCEQPALYVYTASEYTASAVAIGFGETPEQARLTSLAASRQRPTPQLSGGAHGHETLVTQVTTARLTSLRSLRSLGSPNGILAGLPSSPFPDQRNTFIAALGRTRDFQQNVIREYLQSNILPNVETLPWLCLLVRQYGALNLPKPLATALKSTFEQASTEFKKRLGPSGLLQKDSTPYPLEIQAGFTFLLEILSQLQPNSEYARLQATLIGILRRNQTTGNSTLAYLLQPQLYSQALWRATFDALASSTPLEAVALYRFDPKRYASTITSILERTTADILWGNWLGHAEDASVPQSASAAGLYLFLLKELDGYGSGQVEEATSSFWEATAEDSRANFWM